MHVIVAIRFFVKRGRFSRTFPGAFRVHLTVLPVCAGISFVQNRVQTLESYYGSMRVRASFWGTTRHASLRDGCNWETFGGASRDRTDDLIVANDALSQLSYSPMSVDSAT